ncbi:MAG: hypothetical protein EAZ92_10345 [Candidatus Kapaibacterium sp.]|nr:MAG: hypothetical protein EAZ92_10345 [Candidatus Kapabacteria bacterium]
MRYLSALLRLMRVLLSAVAQTFLSVSIGAMFKCKTQTGMFVPLRFHCIESKKWYSVLRLGIFAWMFSLYIFQGVFAQKPLDSLRSETSLKEGMRFGISGHALWGLHSAQFRALALLDASRISCCSQNYVITPRLGFSASVFGEIPIFPQASIAARLGITGLSASFFQQDSLVFGGGVRPIPGVVGYYLQTSFLWLDIEPYFVFRPLPALFLQAGVGGKIALASAFEQYEQFILPPLPNVNWATFPYNEAKGSINGIAGFLPTASIGAGYEIPLATLGNSALLIAPEIFAHLPLGSLIAPEFLRARAANGGQNQGFWTMIALKGGFSLRLAPASPEASTETLPAKKQEIIPATPDSTRLASNVNPPPPAQTLPKVENIVPEKKTVESSSNQVSVPVPAKPVFVSITGQRSNSAITENFLRDSANGREAAPIQVVETLASRSRYVLNNIFFGPNSSQLDARYQRLEKDQRGQFYLEDLADLEILPIYYQVLNIIGQRMNTHSNAVLTLTGFADALQEKNDKELAKSRAEVVRAYLLSIWGISPERILTKVGLSRTPSAINGDEILESEEQRRVEIQCSNSPEVLEELRFEYRIRAVEPPKLRIRYTVPNAGTPDKYTLLATQLVNDDGWTEKTQELFRPPNTSPDAAGEVLAEWDVTNPKHQPVSRNPVNISLRGDTNIVDIRTEIPVQLVSVEDKLRNKVPDERVDSYTLFSFAYGTNAPLSGNSDALRIIQQIKQTLKVGATVVVRGYSDSRGNPATNLSLSGQRAQSVANLIGFAGADVKGIGVTNLSDNRLPEGRFYNRYVQVDVRTPLR